MARSTARAFRDPRTASAVGDFAPKPTNCTELILTGCIIGGPGALAQQYAAFDAKTHAAAPHPYVIF